MIRTSCEKCIFKTTDDNGVQNGCILSRLDKYIEKGKASLKLDSNSYLIDSLCVACKAHDQFNIETTTPEKVRKEISIGCTFIIDGSSDYWKLLKKILNQKLMPKNVYVVINESFNDGKKYIEYLNYFKNKGSNLSIKRYYEKKSFLQCVDDIVNDTYTQYYTILSCEEDLEDDYLQKIDIEINDNLKPLVAILSDGNYKNTFSTYLHKMAYGNNIKPLKEKVLEQYQAEGNKGDTVWIM